MRFTDAYAAAPVCSPTRAAIMTGQSPARLGITNHLPDRKQFQPENAKLRSAKTLEHLPLEPVTLAERLKEAHYATAFLGKWHLSGRGTAKDGDLAEPKLRPEYQGFDVNVGGCGFGGPPSYFEPYRIPNIKPRREGDYKLIKWYDDESVELYNLADDLSEKNDLSEKMPRKALDLKRKLEAWLVESGASMPELI